MHRDDDACNVDVEGEGGCHTDGSPSQGRAGVCTSLVRPDSLSKHCIYLELELAFRSTASRCAAPCVTSCRPPYPLPPSSPLSSQTDPTSLRDDIVWPGLPDCFHCIRYEQAANDAISISIEQGRTEPGSVLCIVSCGSFPGNTIDAVISSPVTRASRHQTFSCERTSFLARIEEGAPKPERRDSRRRAVDDSARVECAKNEVSLEGETRGEGSRVRASQRPCHPLRVPAAAAVVQEEK